MQTGTVKWFNARKGVGMITPLAGGQDVVVLPTKISGNGVHTLTEGQTVEFEAEPGKDMPQAVSVRPVV